MDLAFVLSPLGLLFYALLLAVAYSHFRAARSNLVGQRAASRSLMAAGKEASMQRLGLMLEVRRGADHYAPLFSSLVDHASTVEVLAIVYHTAGPKAAAGIRRLARQAGVSVQVVTYKKGMPFERIIRRSNAPVFMRVESGDRLSNRFPAFISYALATGVSAVIVPHLRVPSQTLATAFESLTTIIQHSYRRSFALIQPNTLPYGVAVRRTALTSTTPTLPIATLADSFALITTNETSTKQPRVLATIVVLASIALLVALFTTPIELFSFLSLVLGVLLWMSALLTIIATRPLRAAQKAALIFVVPFYPLYVWFRAITLLTKRVRQ